MNIIKLKVNNFEIIPEEKSYVIENQVNEFALEFEFDDTWDFQTRYVVFNCDNDEETTYKRPIINNQVVVPSELVNGRTTIQIYAHNIENDEIIKRKPSFKYSFSILNSLSPEGVEETDLPTPTQWEIYISQIEEMCNDLQDQFNDLKEECETKCDDVIERLEEAEQDIQTNTDNIRTNAENIDKLNTDLLDYSLITETGNKISMSINSQTYVITLSLKDKNDNILSTQSVDLPLETMIVSASYSNGILTFTLKNGQTLQVQISDLIDGLVSTDTFNQAVQGLSNRITANADDISDIKGEQLTQNADIESLQQENERLSRIVSGLPTKNASGTNIVLNDMVNCEIKEISLKGDNLQVSDNKMITTNQNYYINGTATAYGKGGENTGVAISIIPGATYTIKATATLSRYRIGTTATLGDSGSLNNGAIYDGTSTTATITSSDSYLIINANDLTKINITTSTPTPSDPIEIQSVKGNQTIKCCGVNIYEPIASDINLNGLTPIVNADGSLSASGTLTQTWSNLTEMVDIYLLPGTYTFSVSKTYNYRCVMRCFHNKIQEGAETNYTNVEIASGNTSKTITFIDSVYHLRFYITGVTVNSEINEIFKIQLEKGSTATSFEKYDGTNYQVSLGTIELCKIGDYQDKIYKQNDKWYLRKEIMKRIFDGSETYTIGNVLENTTDFRINNSIGAIATGSDSTNFYNDRFVRYAGAITDIECSWLNGSGLIRFRINTSTASTIEEFKEWVRNNNITAYYIMATPTDTEITDATLISQLEALNNYILLTNNTIISNGNLPVINDITGYVDIMSLLSTQDNRNVVEEKKIVTKPVEEPIDEPIEEPVETKEEER